MTDGMLSAADVAAVTRNNDGCNDMWGGGGWWIWIILIAFLFPMMGGWNRNNGVETGVQDNFISDEFVKRDIFNTNQNVSNTACQTQGIGMTQLCRRRQHRHSLHLVAAISRKQFLQTVRLHASSCKRTRSRVCAISLQIAIATSRLLTGRSLRSTRPRTLLMQFARLRHRHI